MSSEKGVSAIEALEIFREANLSNSEICKMEDTIKDEYKRLFEKLKVSKTAGTILSTKEKGEILEELVEKLVAGSGKIFEVERNIRTGTNEIDQWIELSQVGKCLCKNGLIDSKLKNIIGESKNYKVKVGVTYIGKLFSLMKVTYTNVAILFSYEGVTGQKWNAGHGLIKKIYMAKEKLEEKYYIIDFNQEHFERIYNDDNILDIIKEQMDELRLDTDFSQYIVKHPAEDKIGRFASEN